MTAPRPCPPAPGPLEDYAKRFDHLFGSLAQRRSFRAYLTGLLLPYDRNKTLTLYFIHALTVSPLRRAFEDAAHRSDRQQVNSVYGRSHHWVDD
jgi:hypothetical protein